MNKDSPTLMSPLCSVDLMGGMGELGTVGGGDSGTTVGEDGPTWGGREGHDPMTFCKKYTRKALDRHTDDYDQ